MIIYEVNLDIAPAIYEEYCEWLEEHIAEILCLPGFLHAKRYAVIDVDASWRKISIHYYLENLLNLDAYLQNHASQLREKAIAKFGQKFQAQRRVLAEIS